MSYVGKWVFHSVGMINENDEMVYMRAEEYLNAPMPYVDETDEEAVADEMKERKQTILITNGLMIMTGRWFGANIPV